MSSNGSNLRVRAAPVLLLLALFLVGCGGGSISGGADGAVDAQPVRLDAGAHDHATSPPDVADAKPPGDSVGVSDGLPGGAYPGKQARQVTLSGSTFTYHLYLPTSYNPSKPLPLISLFHGQGDSGKNMRDFWSATAETQDFIVLATSSTGSSGGWSPSADGPRYEAALNDALAAYAVDQKRIYVWGFSAGAHLVHGIALLNAGTFAAYAVSAGVLAGYAGNNAPATATRKIPVAIRVGTSDPLLPQVKADRGRFLAAGWVEGKTLSYVQFSGGHTILSTHPKQIWSFLQGHALP